MAVSMIKQKPSDDILLASLSITILERERERERETQLC